MNNITATDVPLDERLGQVKRNFHTYLERFGMSLSLKQRIIFIKQLSVLVRAGVPLLSSLRMIQKQTKLKPLRRILERVIKDVENGQYLATALGKFRYTFGELTINIIAVGEISGNLSNNLDYLALSLRKQQALKSKIISASIYPIFIVTATISIAIMLTVFFFPKVLPVFKSVQYELPWATKFLIFVSDTMRIYGWLILVVGVIVVISAMVLLQVKKIRYRFDMVLLFVPLINQLVRSYHTAGITRTLGLLLSTGVGVVQTFHITSNTTTHLVYKQELQAIADYIAKGGKISTRLTLVPRLFVPMVADLVAVGETTGKLSDTFLYLADAAEQETDDLTKNLSTMIEPLLLVAMGILVGFIAISIILPIYGITQHLTPK